MPSVNRLIALPAPMPVMKIIKLHKAGIVKDLLNAPKIQNNAIATQCDPGGPWEVPRGHAGAFDSSNKHKNQCQ